MQRPPTRPPRGRPSRGDAHGKVRRGAARVLALPLGSRQYRHVNDIPKNNREQSVPVSAGEWVSPEHAHLRGPGYYQ